MILEDILTFIQMSCDEEALAEILYATEDRLDEFGFFEGDDSEDLEDPDDLDGGDV